MSAHLVRAAGFIRGEHVLDVACGTGITAITACRAGAKVTGIDLTTELFGTREGRSSTCRCNGRDRVETR